MIGYSERKFFSSGEDEFGTTKGARGEKKKNYSINVFEKLATLE